MIPETRSGAAGGWRRACGGVVVGSAEALGGEVLTAPLPLSVISGLARATLLRRCCRGTGCRTRLPTVSTPVRSGAGFRKTTPGESRDDEIGDEPGDVHPRRWSPDFVASSGTGGDLLYLPITRKRQPARRVCWIPSREPGRARRRKEWRPICRGDARFCGCPLLGEESRCVGSSPGRSGDRRHGPRRTGGGLMPLRRSASMSDIRGPSNGRFTARTVLSGVLGGVFPRGRSEFPTGIESLKTR